MPIWLEQGQLWGTNQGDRLVYGLNNAGSIIGVALAPDYSSSRAFLLVRDDE